MLPPGEYKREVGWLVLVAGSDRLFDLHLRTLGQTSDLRQCLNSFDAFNTISCCLCSYAAYFDDRYLWLGPRLGRLALCLIVEYLGSTWWIIGFGIVGVKLIFKCPTS